MDQPIYQNNFPHKVELFCLYIYTGTIKWIFENFQESTIIALNFLKADLAIETKYELKSNLEVMQRLKILEDWEIY